MEPAEGVESLLRILGDRSLTRVAVSTGDLDARLDRYVRNARPVAAVEAAAPAAAAPRYARPEVATAYVAPTDEIERTIASVWQGVLGIGEIGRDDNFFDLGGHSLLLIQVHATLVEKLGRPLAVTDLFQYSTIASLAAHVGGGRREAPVVRVAEQSGRRHAKRRRHRRHVRPVPGRGGSPGLLDEPPERCGVDRAPERDDVAGGGGQRRDPRESAICEGGEHAGRHRSVRCGVLRVFAAGGGTAGSAAAAVPGMRMGSAGTGGLRPETVRRADRRLRRRQLQRIPRQCRVQSGNHAGRRGAAGRPGESRRPSADARVVQAEPARAEPERADGVLDVARGGAPGLSQSRGRRMRHGAGRRRVRLASASPASAATSIRKRASCRRTGTAARSTRRRRARSGATAWASSC